MRPHRPGCYAAGADAGRRRNAVVMHPFLMRMFISNLWGLRLGDWIELLRRHGFAVEPRYFARALCQTLYSGANSALAAYESARHGAAIRNAVVPPPLFVLGHWRSGTTHLHNLLACDPQFVAPTLHQAFFPRTFLTTRSWLPPLCRRVLPPTRRIDNMELSPDAPWEDEFALNLLTVGLSPLMGWTWTREAEAYDRYLTMRDASEAERARWSDALRWFAKKLHIASGKVPVLKSPQHTGRTWLLRQIFPGARFLHIHRHPEQVFQSTRIMLRQGTVMACLQRPREDDVDGRLLATYRTLHDSYFRDVDEIGQRHLVEIGFAELVADPLGTLERAYDQLGIDGFARAAPKMQALLNSRRDYRANEHGPLDSEERRRVAETAAVPAARWGYSFP